jgi:hypothetical protein
MSDTEQQQLLIDGVDGVSWCLDSKRRIFAAYFLTRAEWRKMQQAAVKGDKKHTLRQFRMATLLLELADRSGLPEDAVLMPTLGFRSKDFTLEALVHGADGVWRVKQPGVVIDLRPGSDQPIPAT